MDAAYGAEWARPLKRISKDMEFLRAKGYPILREDGRVDKDLDPTQWCTLVHGPVGTPYEGGTWRVRFTFGKTFPHDGPSVGFVDRILHPNIDWRSGSVCVDTLSKEWDATIFIIAVVEIILPNLMSMPNPTDPLNPDAAARMQHNPAKWDADVRAAVRKHAYTFTPLAAPEAAGDTLHVPAPVHANAGAGADSESASESL